MRRGYPLYVRNAKQGRVALDGLPENEIHVRVPVAFPPSPYSACCLMAQGWTELRPSIIVPPPKERYWCHKRVTNSQSRARDNPTHPMRNRQPDPNTAAALKRRRSVVKLGGGASSKGQA